MSLEKLKERVKNSGKKVKISFRKISEEKYSLYLDYHHFIKGREIRERISLKQFITGQEKLYKREKQIIDDVHEKRDHYEKIAKHKKQGIFIEGIKVFLFEWTEKFKEKQTKYNSMKAWRSMIKHLRNFQKQNIPLENVNNKFCEDFANYLLKLPRISQNSAHTYYTRFKIAIKRAYEENIIPRNYTSNIKIRKKDTKREFLTLDELKLIKEKPYVNERVKRAFIFSCYTGLRLGDLYKLKFTDIIADGDQLFISFIDEKTREYNRINLHPTAVKIFKKEKQDHRSGNVFILPCKSTFGYHVDRMVRNLGIQKHITPHCARHTFATLSINNGMDLYTLSKYLGHNDVKVTQIYAKLIDKRKDEAIYKIPEI